MSVSPDPSLVGVVVIPCLNEARTIGKLLAWLAPQAEQLNMLVVVADGGSTDGTVVIVRQASALSRCIRLVANGRRIQSAGVNLALRHFSAGTEFIVRIDAHATYPGDYLRTLVEEQRRVGADSVVVAMHTVGTQIFQRAVAAAQNSILGNGGADHRRAGVGKWVEHGHHALIRTSVFAALGGYDETFTHNEDAEFDCRLREAGGRIWMTDRTAISYFPRRTPAALFGQYIAYGRGRAKTLFKHSRRPGVRQMIPLLIAPAVLFAVAALAQPLAVLPVGAWIAVCLGYGAWLAIRGRDAAVALSGAAFIIMHLAWSLGFWDVALKSTLFRRGAIS